MKGKRWRGVRFAIERSQKASREGAVSSPEEACEEHSRRREQQVLGLEAGVCRLKEPCGWSQVVAERATG